MIKKSIIQSWLFAVCLTGFATAAPAQGNHLFILSGQSNMAQFKPELSFLPAVEKAFGKNSVVVVRDAESGTGIGRWYSTPKNSSQKGNGPLYDRLMAKVTEAMNGKSFQTVTFIWMQGESDGSKNGTGPLYGTFLNGLVTLLKSDLKRDDLNVVIGRISDHGLKDPAKWPKWADVRDAEVKFAESSKRYAWVDTDDLNGPADDLHYNAEGSMTLGNRFAQKAIELIRAKP